MKRPVIGLLATFALALPFGAEAASAQQGPIDEVRLQVLDHDTGIVGSSKEDGADIGVEVFSHPITQLRFIGAPRFVVGALLNTAGQTNQVYAGISARQSFAHGTFRDDDSFFIEGVVGAAWHDGKIDVRNTPEDADWKSHGSHLLFRTGFGVGYNFSEHWSVAMTFAHISNANLAQPNQGSNDLGLALGWKF